ncbi:PREDICTED: uncharacterized protein LOC100637719 [Amphimedon queenslandica]|uniref:TGF-beta family profile domain-containing protein n=1 Tax=Amphimedon queenslandica TaxID=400682 RepID=A0A1X7UI86_AMPQE|nr:PREDICTED: uncharacterized protein LOC100637719 [Amphimedon queenslandica]|eukprot:XP_003387904.1 PREDICTED: uncharacterized protein LOC100637719 [Amphimedon queenslandica]
MSIAVSLFTFLLISGCLSALSENRNNPSYAFMEITRRRVEERLQGSSHLDYPYSVNGRDKVATTMEPTSIQGLTDSGHFNVTERNRIELEFDFQPQNLDQVKFFKAAHLWLFPTARNDTKDHAKTLEIGLLVAITTPSMKGEKRKRFSLLWDKETQSCLSIDVTIPLHKLIKQLQLRNEMTGKMIVEVIHIKKRSRTEEGGWTSDILEVCKELSGIENSTRIPFLVIDFTAEEIASGRRPRTPSQPESRVITRELSSVDMQQMYREARGISTNKNDTAEEKPSECPVHDLEVSLSSILNIGTVPDVINIGECRGSCSLSYNSHSNLKTYYRYMTEKVPAANNCCIPRTFDSVTFLSFYSSNSTEEFKSIIAEIEVLPDAIIRSCMCFNIQPTTSD